MAPPTLTEYERQRLDNIKRNDDMMASLKLHSTAQQLSSATRRKRFKVAQVKKPKPQTPIKIRRSLRCQGMAPDLSSVGGFDFQYKIPKSAAEPELSQRNLGPLSMRDAYTGISSDRKLIATIMGISENAPLSCSINGEFGGNRSSHDAIMGMSENAPLSGSIKGGFDRDGGSYDAVMGMSENAPLSCSIKREGDGSGRYLDLGLMTLSPENIARVVPENMLNVKFFPSTDRLIIVVGNSLGNVGFWDLDCKEGEGDNTYLYRPHTRLVSGISIQPFALSKVFSSCSGGFIRLLDIEKESFDLVYSSEDAIFSLSQCPRDAKSLYFGKAQGGLNVWDERAGKFSSSWILHDERINSIDFNPNNTNLMVTSSTDGTARIWDLRNIEADRPKTLKIINHERAVQSAYFSPSGNYLASTSVDKVRVMTGVDFGDMAMIHDKNCVGSWTSVFRAIWGWDDSRLFIGNNKRRVDVISTTDGKTVMSLESPLLSAIPCRFAAHPYKAGILAGATLGGHVYVWTS